MVWLGLGCWKVLAALATLGLFALPAAAEPTGEMEAYIKALPRAERTSLIRNYIWSGGLFSGFLKYREPPQIYVSCPPEGCPAPTLRVLDALQMRAAGTLGMRSAKAEAAGIEVYLAPQPDEFDKRDRDLDARLGLDANLTSRKLLDPDSSGGALVTAPCWTVTYFDMHSGVIEKALIFIDSNAPARLQSLCMGFELVRATGVANTASLVLYRKLKAGREGNALKSLAVNAYLHGLPEIQPKDTMEKAYRLLANRYGLKETF